MISAPPRLTTRLPLKSGTDAPARANNLLHRSDRGSRRKYFMMLESPTCLVSSLKGRVRQVNFCIDALLSCSLTFEKFDQQAAVGLIRLTDCGLY